MTTTTTATTLAPVTEGQLALVRGKSFEIGKLADELAAPLPEGPVEGPPFPDLPKPVELTEEQTAALKLVAKVFNTVNLTTRRALTAAELRDLSTEAAVLEMVLKPLGSRKDVIKDLIRQHLDVDAEERGVAFAAAKTLLDGTEVEATPRDRNGHYLLAQAKKPFDLVIGGFKKGWQQRFTSGSVNPSQALLDDLLTREEITQAEYNAFTKQVRVLDTARISVFIEKNPARGLAIFRAILKREAANSALYPPER